MGNKILIDQQRVLLEEIRRYHQEQKLMALSLDEEEFHKNAVDLCDHILKLERD